MVGIGGIMLQPEWAGSGQQGALLFAFLFALITAIMWRAGAR